MHESCALGHLHRFVMHLVLQEHVITSMQVSGTGERDIRTGFKVPETLTTQTLSHPVLTGKER